MCMVVCVLLGSDLIHREYRYITCLYYLCIIIMCSLYPDPMCPADKVFTMCGSACPETCENKDEIIPCTLQCVKGTSSCMCTVS